MPSLAQTAAGVTPLAAFGEQDIRTTFDLLHTPGTCIELRAPKAGRYGVISGYFDNAEALIKAARQWNGRVPGLYVTLNPVPHSFLARAHNRATPSAEHTTADTDILLRRWLPLDFDPVRPSGVSSTDEEKKLAFNVAQTVQHFLRGLGWPEPVLADSGNGAHLLYRIDLPNDERAAALVRGCIDAISFRFADNRVAIDQKVFNAARIWKLYGTIACKGDNVPERPHRLARLLSVPEKLEPVPEELLAALAAMRPPEPKPEERPSLGDFDLARWIAEHNLPVKREAPWNGGRKWVLNPCPWNPDHRDNSAYIVQFPNGAIAAGCHHNGCQGKGWHELRDLYEPGWRDRREERTKAKEVKAKESVNEVERDKKSKALRLIELAGEAQLFHTRDGNTYATFQVDGHKETWPLRSKGFKRWLLRRFYQQEGKPGGQAVEDALQTLEAKAHFDSPEFPVYSRVAEKGGNIYLDLGDENWQAVEITPAGWRVVADPPVKFRRARGIAALPVPVKGGSIDELRAFVNVPDEDSWRLLVAWLVMAFRPTGPYPILILQGEQGSAKSTTARVLRALVDPSTAPLRTTPREERDLMIAANNAWVLAFDNLSGISPWLSDALCRLATGGGFATRELYTNDEEVIFDAMRPVVINGIDELTSRQDLLDRAIILNLPAIPEEKRRDETAFWREFEEARPRILGALLDAVSSGLRNFDAVKLDRLPRMADFAKWLTACEEALPWEAGGFLEAYMGNKAEAVELALEADVVAVAVRALLEEREVWEETPTNLLQTLRQYVPEDTQRTKVWPNTAKGLSSRLRRAATFLRQTGIEVEFLQTAGSNSERRIRLTKRLKEEKSVATVASVAGNQKSLEALGFSDATQMRRKNGDATQGTFVASHLKALSHKQCDERDASDARKCTFSNASIVEAVITDPAKVREAESLFPHPTVQRSPFRCPRCGGEDFWQDEKGFLHCSHCRPQKSQKEVNNHEAVQS